MKRLTLFMRKIVIRLWGGIDFHEIDRDGLGGFNGNAAVMWTNQYISAGTENTYVFYGKAAEHSETPDELTNLWYVNGERVSGDRIIWENAELLVTPKTVPSEFVYENAQVKITVIVPDDVELPPDAVLEVRPVAENTDEFEEAAEKVEKASEAAILKHVVYDIGFTADGEKVEPQNGEVQVSCEFKQNIFGEEASSIENSNVKVYHIEDGSQVVDVSADVNTNADGTVESLDFFTESFSIHDFVVYALWGNDTNQTFEMDGGQYSLGYLFRNYNVFVDGDYTNQQHIVGSIAVGGNVTSATGIGGSSTGEIPYRNGASTYIKGTTNIKDIVIRSDDPNFPTYFGTVNKGSGINVKNQVNAQASPYYFTDQYIDFNRAMAAVKAETSNAAKEGITIPESEMDTVINGPWGTTIERENYKITTGWSGKVTLTVKAGKTYHIENLSKVVDLNYEGENEIIGSTDTIIYSYESNVELPTIVRVNGNVLGSLESGGSFSNVVLLPNATNVSGVGFSGHISAPNAAVTMTGGFFNGCIIAHTMGGAAEGHMWPYNGNVFRAGEATFKIKKTVDGKAPGDKRFDFVMKKVLGPNGNEGDSQGESEIEVKSTNDSDGKIQFETITGYQVPGTYIYKIFEEGTYPGYDKNTTVYYAKIDVTESQDGNDTVYVVSEPEYYTGYDSENGLQGSVESVEFNNTTINGSLKIKKEAGENTALGQDEIFYFLVKDSSENVVKRVNGDRESNTWAIAGSGSVTIDNLIPDVYTVTETTEDGQALGDTFAYYVTGGGAVTVTDGQTAEVTVTNTKVTGSIEVTKQVTGTTRTDDFFVAVFNDAAGVERVADQEVKRITANATVTFDGLVPGTYYVFETNEKGEKLSDEVVNGYKIPVNGSGAVKLTNTSNTPKESVTLLNRWLETSIALTGIKDARSISPDKRSFRFSLYELAEEGAEVNEADKPIRTAQFAGGLGEFTFEPLVYDLRDMRGSTDGTKTFYYLVKEDYPEGAVLSGGHYVYDNVYYDTTAIPIEVKVQYEAAEDRLSVESVKVKGKTVNISDGKCSLSEGKTPAFVNYSPTGNSTQIPVKKQIRTLVNSDKEFVFKITSPNGGKTGFKDSNYADPYREGSVRISGSGMKYFDAIYFEEAGTYTYYVEEESFDYAGYKKDQSKYEVTITVEEENGELKSPTVAYKKIVDENGQTVEEAVDEVVFYNQFESAFYQIPVSKTINGWTSDLASDKVFSFSLEAASGVSYRESNCANIFTQDIETITGAGNAAFDRLYFNAEGTYTYTLKEEDIADDGLNGYTKDQSEYLVTLTVGKGGDHKLVVTDAGYQKIKGKDGKPCDSIGEYHALPLRETEGTIPVFDNDYKVTGTQYQIPVSKVVAGNAPEEKAFDFTLEKAFEDAPSGFADKAYEKAFVKSCQSVRAGETNCFDTIYYKEAGVYQYYLTENDLGADYSGYTKDQSKYLVTVTVTDDNSQLKVDYVQYMLLKDKKGNDIAPDSQTAEKLEEDGSIIFVNDYSAANSSYVLQVEKRFDGPGPEWNTDRKFCFTMVADNRNNGGFISEEDSDGTVQEKPFTISTVMIQGKGRKNFPEIRYKQAGTYTYTVLENDLGEGLSLPDGVEAKAYYAGFGKDSKVYTVTVKVEDRNGTLEVTGETYKEKGAKGDGMKVTDSGIVFTNQYTTAGTSYELPITKAIAGLPEGMTSEEEFRFILSSVDERDAGYEDEKYTKSFEEKEAVITGQGTEKFEPIYYNREGTYEYILKEDEVTADGYTRDTKEYKLAVNVEDKNSQLTVTSITYEQINAPDGAVKVSGSFGEDEERGITFTNTYTNTYTASGSLELTAEKILDGNVMRDKQFAFELKDAEGKVLQTVTNDAAGKIVFEALSYTEADIAREYTYTVSEKNTGEANIVYDNTVYTVMVKVENSEDGSGRLKITKTITTKKQAVKDMRFTNRFEGSVKLLKTDTEGKLLSGAQFQMYKKLEDGSYKAYAGDENANGLYTTDDQGIIAVTGLPVGEYYFVERKAPDGYVISKEADGLPMKYPFTIAAGTGSLAAELTVVNERGIEGSISVTKRTTLFKTDKTVDIKMKNAVFYVGLFQDAEGTLPYGTDYVRAISMRGQSSSEPIIFSGLKSGTYYILETDAKGAPIPLNTRQSGKDVAYMCTVDGGGSNKVVLDLTAEQTKGAVNLNNVYYELPTGFYRDGEISITKKVLRNGEETKEDVTFYAGIFTGKDGSGTLYKVVELVQNGTVTVSVPLGGADGTEAATYYVYETDSTGRMLDKDGFIYEVSGEGAVTVTANQVNGSITITNSINEEKKEEKENETKKDAGTKETGNAVKTGDDTDIALHLVGLVMSAAMILMIVLASLKRKREK